MPETIAPAPPRHLDYLDSARGIAALMVMVYHYINWKYDHHTVVKLASIVFNGNDAVSFFFVLSGFVLSYKYIVLQQPLDIRKFYITRFFRLWPAYFVVIFFTVLNGIRYDLSFHNLINVFILNKKQFWEEAILVRGHPLYYVPGWTLVIELAMSFFIPFYVVLAKKGWQIILWLFLAYVLSGDTSFYFHFILGVMISCIFVKVRNSSFKETKWYSFRYLILAVAVALFSIRQIDKLYQLGPTYTYIAGYLGINFFHYTGIASFVFIIAIIISNNTRKILRYKPLLFLGKISYGIYLVHWVLVVDIFFYWEGRIRPLFPNTASAFIIMFCIYTVMVIALATILHYAIELPFIKLGKRLAQRMKPSLVID